MKVKNLMIGEIAKIGYMEVRYEDYSPSYFDDSGYMPHQIGKGLFYKIGKYAFDVEHFKGFKLVERQYKYPQKLDGKKVVIPLQPFSDLSVRHDISRKDAVLVYKNRVVK